MDKLNELCRQLPMAMLDEEWKYFQENARRTNPEHLELGKEYFILPMGAEPKEENIIYASDPRELRVQHLLYINKYGMSTSHKVRINLNWLERMEGKR